jgi:ATP-dependent RNA helicase DHX37/DHR1
MPLDEEVDLFSEYGDDDDQTDMDKTFELDSDNEQQLLNEQTGSEEEEEEEGGGLNSQSTSQKPLFVLPLYSLLPSEKQVQVFDKVPENCRLCVVATNIAETSLTIPNIKYVVDTGKIKMKFYDKITGVSTFRICWTSKASADQRAGRAGRTSAGHCYRLYSSAVYNDEFPKFSEPEIARKPVEDLILQMKDLGIDRIVNFPFPTPPDDASVRAAERLLIELDALEVDKSKLKSARDEQITKITKLGKQMASFPINPRYSKMLTLASQQQQIENKKKILSYVICLISGLSVPELFIDGDTQVASSKQPNEMIKVKYAQLRQSWLDGVPKSHTHLLGDLMLLLVALGAVEYEQHKNANDKAVMAFCDKFGIRYKAVLEARKLRKQLVNTGIFIYSSFEKIFKLPLNLIVFFK